VAVLLSSEGDLRNPDNEHLGSTSLDVCSQVMNYRPQQMEANGADDLKQDAAAFLPAPDFPSKHHFSPEADFGVTPAGDELSPDWSSGRYSLDAGGADYER
jgi:hypothetical protein